MKKIVNCPPIGEIEVVTRRGVWKTTYSVSAKRVRITTSLLGLQEVFPLSEERVKWIVESRKRLLEKVPNEGKINPTEEIKTANWTLRFVASSDVKTGFVIRKEGEMVKVYYRMGVDFEDDDVQLAARRILLQLLQKEAKECLPKRLDMLAAEHGFEYEGVRINSATSRWGSCSAKKHINLSAYLMLLDWEEIDYVLVHELCHTKEMNHGPRFKALMREVIADCDRLEKRVKLESKRLILYKL